MDHLRGHQLSECLRSHSLGRYAHAILLCSFLASFYAKSLLQPAILRNHLVASSSTWSPRPKRRRSVVFHAKHVCSTRHADSELRTALNNPIRSCSSMTGEHEQRRAVAQSTQSAIAVGFLRRGQLRPLGLDR